MPRCSVQQPVDYYVHLPMVQVVLDQVDDKYAGGFVLPPTRVVQCHETSNAGAAMVAAVGVAPVVCNPFPLAGESGHCTVAMAGFVAQLQYFVDYLVLTVGLLVDS